MYESPIEKYAREHPGCSLEEYCNYVRKAKEKEIEAEKLQEEEINNLLKSFTGKCFRIDFNGTSISYFKITKDISIYKKFTEVTEDFYSIFADSRITKIAIEKQRIVNYNWLLNKDTYTKCKVISEEVFNTIVKYCQEMHTMVEKLKNEEL